MHPSTDCRPTRVHTASPDERGCLLYVDDRLVAVMVCLEHDGHAEPDLWGRWFIEAGFGPCTVGGQTLTFASPDEAQVWARTRVTIYETRLS